jgi:WD40 repeat protein
VTFSRASCTLLAVVTLSWPVHADEPAEWRAWKLPGAEPLPAGARLRLGSGGVLMPLTGAAALSPDGKVLALANAHSCWLFERSTGKEIARIADPADSARHAGLVGFSPNGQLVVFGNTERLTVASVPAGKVLREIAIPATRSSYGATLSFSADSKWITLSGFLSTTEIHVFELATGKKHGPFKIPPIMSALKAVLSEDGKLLATCVTPRPNAAAPMPVLLSVLQLWDVATGQELRRLEPDRSNGVVAALAFGPHGKSLVVAVDKSDIQILPDRTILSGLNRRVEIQVLDTATGKEQGRMTGMRGATGLLTYSPSGEVIIAVNREGRVYSWNVRDEKRRDYPAGPLVEPLSLALHASGPGLVLGRQGETLVWWDAATGTTALPHKGHWSHADAAAFAPSGKNLTTASKDGDVFTWDTLTGAVQRQATLVDEKDLLGIASLRRASNIAVSSDARLAAVESFITSAANKLT